MNLLLKKIEQKDVLEFKKNCQDAFQKGYEAYFGPTSEIIIPERDIDESLNAKGAVAYKAVLDGEVVGGAALVINEETNDNELGLLFVKCGVQSKGIGQEMWRQIELLYPKTKTWETCTPYFDKRNIHFYVNVCGFHIVEFFNTKHPMKECPDDFVGDAGEGMFLFKKVIGDKF